MHKRLFHIFPPTVLRVTGQGTSHSWKGPDARANRYMFLLRCAAHQLPLSFLQLLVLFVAVWQMMPERRGTSCVMFLPLLPVCIAEYISLCYMSVVPMGAGHCAIWGCRAEIKVKKQHRERRYGHSINAIGSSGPGNWAQTTSWQDGAFCYNPCISARSY